MAMVLVPGVLRLGPFHLPVYGVFAALGLIAALWLSQKTARLVGLDQGAVWDAGWFGVFAAFVVSRLLLVVENPRGFLRLPLVLLSLPSFTYVDMVLTAAAVAVYLRWKRLPLLKVLDAWAPCAAVLAAMLSLGRFFEGADPGMPMRLPLGTVVPGSGGLMHFAPVQLYGAAAAGALLVGLMLLLQRQMSSGVVAGIALVVGGLVSFLLEMMTQPEVMVGNARLEPAQWIAVGSMLAGGLVLTFRKELA